MLLALAGTAPAADLTVEVRNREGSEVLADVAVCLGTAANPKQFGAFRSGSDGRVLFTNLPLHAHLLTVSKAGYLGSSRLLDAMNVERVIQVDLARGGGGPVCEAELSLSPEAAPAGLQIEAFRLDDGASLTRKRDLQLRHRLSGSANQYRVSERADFAGAEWQPYVAAPHYTLSEGRGEKRVYFQVRRYVSVGDSSLETLSPVVSDRIRLE